jgi:hypothetical protein
LPAGKPPVGQHIVLDRTLSGVFFTASEVDGVPSHLLATGPLGRADHQEALPNWTDLLADVYEFPVVAGAAPKSGLSDSQPFARSFVLQDGDVSQYTFQTDRRGRPVYLTYQQYPWGLDGSTVAGVSVERFDWTTGFTQYAGQYNPHLLSKVGAPFLLSPGRTRIFTGSLTELDGWTDLGSLDPTQGAFIGEDLYYVASPTGSDTGRRSLGRSRPGAEPELLLSSTGSLGLGAIEGDGTPQVLVSLRTIDYAANDGGYAPLGLLDTETKAFAELPAQAQKLIFVSASSDGHWLLFRDKEQYTGPGTPLAISVLFAYDWTTGKSTALDSTVLGDTMADNLMGTYWRPQHHEVWFSLSDNPSGLVVWRPDRASSDEGASGMEVVNKIPGKDGDYFNFTSDGRYWLAIGQSPICLGDADNLSAPLLPLHPQGTGAAHVQQMSDGRWLVGASTTDYQRQDISIVDPVTRTSRTIATGGHVVALGQTRALAILNWESTRQAGDLTLVDLATAEQTLLAENVYAAAVDHGTTTDAGWNGARIGFLTRSRLESPYDGLWVATLP